MKRFIHHSELARDSRFIRQDNAMSTVLAELPDDVDTVVEVFEKFSPMIEASVQGTAAEPLFEAYGPAFGLVTLNQPIKAGDAASKNRLQLRMHGIFVGEVQALEGAGRSLWDFPDAPWEFKMNMARQCWDEARHVQIYEKLLGARRRRGRGCSRSRTFLFECACNDDPAMRVAGVNRGLEGLACDVFRDMIRYAEATGDERHASGDRLRSRRRAHPRSLRKRMGPSISRRTTRSTTRRPRNSVSEVDKQFSFGGARSSREDAAIPIAWEDRKEAGFSDEELQELDEISTGGPSRETLIQAAKILQERHLAKKGEGASA